MKECKECKNCQYYDKSAYRDMGATVDGCKLLQYHKDYGFMESLFTGYTNDKCKYFEQKVSFKEKAKEILGDDFFDEFPEFPEFDD